MADDIVTRLRRIAARCWCAEKSQGEPVGKPFFRCESCDDQLQAADEIERLRAIGDQLVAVMRSGGDTGWDAAIDTWEEARRG